MRTALALILLMTGLAAPAQAWVAGPSLAPPAAGLPLVRAGISDLADTDQRRLNFYAGKLVDEVRAVAEAEQAGDGARVQKHGRALTTTAERYLSAAEAAGVEEAEVDQLFHRHLAEGLEGQVPTFLLSDRGLVGVRSLMVLELETSGGGEGSYVDSIRNSGNSTFGD